MIASQAFLLTVDTGPAPVAITTPANLVPGTTGAAYSQALAAFGGVPPYTWSVISGALPAGLTISSGGVIAGVPTAGGTATFTVKVTDSVSATASQAITLTISYPPLVIASPSTLSAGVAGTAYSQTLAATGGDPPYTWAITSGSLPPLLALSSAGVIGGIPATTGVWTFSVNVYDNNLHAASQTFTLTIELGAFTVATPATLPPGVAGSPYSERLSASGGVPPYAWQVTSGAWPPGLSISSAGAISGTPTAAGTYAFTAQVTDSAAETLTQNFSLTVAAAGTLTRTGIFSQIVAGGGWNTTIWLINASASPVQPGLSLR